MNLINTNPIASIESRLENIDLQIAKIKESLAPLEAEHRELSHDLQILKKYNYSNNEFALNAPEAKFHKPQQFSVRKLIIQEFKDFGFPMSKTDVVVRLAIKRDGINESSIASLLSRLVSDGILKKNGPNKYEIA